MFFLICGILLILHTIKLQARNKEHPPYIKKIIKNEIKGLYTVSTLFYTIFTHLVVIVIGLSYILTL